MHEHKAARAVGVLDHAGPGAALTEQRSLLISRKAGDGNRRGKRISCGLSDYAAGGSHPRQKLIPFMFDRTNVAKSSAGPQPPVDPVDLLAAVAAKLRLVEHC